MAIGHFMEQSLKLSAHPDQRDVHTHLYVAGTVGMSSLERCPEVLHVCMYAYDYYTVTT